MTRAPGQSVTGSQASYWRKVLSHLLLVLLLGLFGGPQGQTDRLAAQASPAAHTQADQAQGILTAQRHLLRAQAIDDPAPDGVIFPADGQVPPHFATAHLALSQPVLANRATQRRLPPVRAPPAV